MATRTKTEESPISEAWTNICVSLLSLEYLICIGIRRIITKKKPKTLGEFLEGQTSIANLICEER